MSAPRPEYRRKRCSGHVQCCNSRRIAKKAASASVSARLTISFTSSQSASWLLSGGCHGALPAMGRCQAKSELVQDSQDGLIDEVIDGLRVIVKCRYGRKNHDAHARKLQHIFEVNVAQRRFADDEH